MQDNRQEKSPIKQRILLFLAKKGVTQYEFYKNTGVTRGVLGQNNGISEDNISRFLAYYPEINIEWLMTGRGEMLTNEPTTTTKQSTITDEHVTTQGVTPELITGLINRIAEQAAEIGRLNERIAQLQREKGKSVSDAKISGTANVG